MDDQKRVAIQRVGSELDGSNPPTTQYHLGDHLQSSNVVLDGTGTLFNREEYRPFGESSFGSYATKRYRFTGQERDEESSLSYHGARYYAPWTAQWTSPDPKGMVDGTNLYGYSRNNPVNRRDPTGTQGEKTSMSDENKSKKPKEPSSGSDKHKGKSKPDKDTLTLADVFPLLSEDIQQMILNEGLEREDLRHIQIRLSEISEDGKRKKQL
jgi:RHS repeat-associated protein